MVANSVPSTANLLLNDLEACGALARDTSNDHPRYVLTPGGRVARGCLHQALDALVRERSVKAPVRRPRRSKRARPTKTKGGRR
jgi:hypothetical protein